MLNRLLAFLVYGLRLAAGKGGGAVSPTFRAAESEPFRSPAPDDGPFADHINDIWAVYEPTVLVRVASGRSFIYNDPLIGREINLRAIYGPNQWRSQKQGLTPPTVVTR